MSQELDRSMHAVAQARRTVAATLRRWELPSLVQDAELLVSELVTNALLHAHSGIALTLAVADGTLEVGVADRSPDVPLPLPAGDPTGAAAAATAADWRAEGGRGLRLVDLLADEWGVAGMPGGKQVWFRLGVGQSWPHLTGCPCVGEDLERVSLESGRYAVDTRGPWDEQV